MQTVEPQPPPKLVEANARLIDAILLAGPGPRPWKLAWVINFQKGGTFLYVLGLMFAYDNFTAPAWTYLVLHGSYGILWLLKHLVMPDRSWEKRVTIAGGLAAFLLVLGPYWVAPFLLISDVLGPARALPSVEVMAGASALYIFGVSIMLLADAQKHFTLRHQRGLITTGMFAHVRHPNYLGEMMLYGSFAMLTMHWLPWAILAYVWSYFFMTNILMKEASMSRYPEWKAYKARTGLLLPWPFGGGAPALAVAPKSGASERPELGAS